MLESKYDLKALDAFAWLESLESDSVDLTVTDPAYESLEKWRATGTTTRLKHSTQSSNDWFPVIKNAQLPELFAQLYRVQKMNTHCYFFCDPETAFIAVPMAKAAGFKFWKPLVWDKKKIGMGYHYRARYEFVLFFEKGKRRLSNMSTPDVLEVVRLKGKDVYPTEKPVALCDIFIKQSSLPGELVIDPFMGSGAVGVAATRAGRNFAGCDINPTAVVLTRRRIKGDADRDAKQLALPGVL